jgi:hypothetical protein
MIKVLQTPPHFRFASPNAGNARPSKGWTPERRALQAARARRAQPWRHATGPRTDVGKARVAMNALRHGYRSRAWLLKARRIRDAIRLCAQTVLLARALMRQRELLASQPTSHVHEAVRASDFLPVENGRPERPRVHEGRSVYGSHRVACADQPGLRKMK